MAHYDNVLWHGMRNIKPGRNTLWITAMVGGPLPDTCIEWPFGRFDTGYGAIWMNGTLRGAHRVAYELAHGPIPDGLCVLHTCIRTRACVNPRHLHTGSHRDNMREMAEQRTSATGDRHRSQTSPATLVRGEDVNTAKLTPEQVIEIRRRHAAGEAKRALGRAYGVRDGTIAKLLDGRSWAHIRDGLREGA